MINYKDLWQVRTPELVSLMSDGIIDVNVDAGEFQNGAIWGQIASGLPPSEVNATSIGPNATLGQWSSQVLFFSSFCVLVFELDSTLRFPNI